MGHANAQIGLGGDLELHRLVQKLSVYGNYGVDSIFSTSGK
jgi:hypothetical protein